MENIIRLLGVNQQVTSHKEKFISFLGGFISIYIIYLVTNQFYSAYPAIKHEDFVYALSQIDSLVDINENDLQEIYGLATGRKNLQRK